MNVVDSESRAHNGEFNYRAFIAHSRADEQWGAWLQKSLEAYKAPRRLVGREGREGAVPRRLVPIYRDNNEISSSKDLGATRRNLLEQSRYLLVVCSPSAATSKWVNEEILQFKRFGYENRILCLIVDGEPNASDKPGLEDSECFCEALRHKIGGDGELADQRAEPIAADIRPGKDGKNGSRLKLVAGLLGVSFDDLRQRDLRRRRWRWIQATAFVLIMVALSVLAGIEANRLALEKAKQRAEFAAEEARRLLRASDVEGSIRTALDGLPSDRSEIDPAVFESLVWTLENAVHQLPLEAVLRGHRGEVLFARFSPDGRRILTAARDWTARIWDVDKGTEIASHSVINLLSTAFSPKGDRVITSQSDKTTRIWDSETGKDVLVLDAQESRTTYAVFDSTGNKVLTGLDDGTLRVWNAKTGKEIATLLGHTKSVTFAAFIQSDDKILTASLDGTVRLWETSTGNPISVIHKQQAAIWSAAMNPAGERLVAGSLGGRAHILEVNTGSAVAVLGEEKRKFMAVRVDPRGKTIATASGSSSGSDYQSAQLWDAETGKQLKTLRGHNHTVLSVAFSPSGTTVITGSKDATARIWNVRTGTELAVLRGHSGDVFQVAFSPSGDRIATASGDGTVRIWRTGTTASTVALPSENTFIGQQVAFDPTGKRVLTVSADNTAIVSSAENGKPLVTLRGRKGLIFFAAFDPSGERIVTTSLDGSIANWDASSGKLLISKRLKLSIWKSALSPTGEVLVTAFNDDRAALWQTGTLKYLGLLQRRTTDGKPIDGKVRSFTFNSTGDKVAIAYGAKKAGRSAVARIWDVPSARELSYLSGHRNTVRTAVFNPAGDRVLTASEDGTARLWRVDPEVSKRATKAEQLFVLRGHADGVLSAAFSPSGDRVVTASRDGTAKVWDAREGNEIATLQGHTGEVYDAVFAPSGEIIATASNDRTVRLWEATTGKVLNVFRGHPDDVDSVRFSPSGRELLSISNGTVLLWAVQPLDVDATITRARRLMQALGQ